MDKKQIKLVMSFQAQLLMILWLPITLYLFTIYPPRKAVIISFIASLMFLPENAGFKLPLIPDYKEMIATCYGIFIGITIYDSQKLNQLKLKWIDVPILLYCISPFFSSISNDLGIYDGINESIEEMAIWGMPYILGRLYLNNFKGLKELTIILLKGGLLYVPLCLYEVRMSPQLHQQVYGYFPHSWGQTLRFGGWRPQVFMEHGLMLGMWMMTVAFVGLWLWQSGSIKKIWTIPINFVVPLTILTMILIKSSGTYVYFLYGVMVLFAAKLFRLNTLLLLLAGIIVIYLIVAVSGNFDGQSLVDFAYKINPQRAQSLEFRFDNEAILGDRARERMLFGWGGWGRNIVQQENWEGIMVDATIADSMWIIIFGSRGILGLISIFASLIIPPVLFAVRYPAKTWFNPQIAPAAVASVVLTLFSLDCLLNYMFNPIFPLISGGLSGLLTSNKSFPKRSTLSLTRKRKTKTKTKSSHR